jgi:hypothetical protein
MLFILNEFCDSPDLFTLEIPVNQPKSACMAVTTTGFVEIIPSNFRCINTLELSGNIIEEKFVDSKAPDNITSFHFTT